ncbi:hypothetical protein D3C76_1618660 [compost metagenome]
MDYGFTVPSLAIFMYICEKIKIKLDKNVYTKLYISFFIFLLALLSGDLGVFMFLSIPFILMYNGELGRKSNIIRNVFYYVFPTQHVILYIGAMIVYKLKM